MPPPIIQKPEDRLPYEPGTRVIYWTWDEGKSARILYRLNAEGGNTTIPLFHGVVDIATAETRKHPHPGWPIAKIGEKIIRYFDQDGKPSELYECIQSIPVKPNEPQRWFAEGVDPNTLPQPAPPAHVEQPQKLSV